MALSLSVGRVTAMLLRTEPFREVDRLTQQLLGTAARPAAMPMDAFAPPRLACWCSRVIGSADGWGCGWERWCMRCCTTRNVPSRSCRPAELGSTRMTAGDMVRKARDNRDGPSGAPSGRDGRCLHRLPVTSPRPPSSRPLARRAACAHRRGETVHKAT
jgi:hypothetical protein